MLRILHLCLFLLIALQTVHSEVYSLKTVVTPSSCRGGEVCDVQPQVSVVNAETLQIVFGFQGDAYVQIGTSPSEYDEMFIGQSCDIDSCGQTVTETIASATFIDGVAKFSGLTFKSAGSYILKFIGRHSNGDLFAQTFTDSFTVTTGPMFKLDFSTFIGTAYGGELFTPNPIIAVVDRGGNIITSLKTGVVMATLTTSIEGPQSLLPSGSHKALISNGLAAFSGMYINKAGYPYQITFNCSLNGIPSLLSDYFDVVVGKPTQMNFIPGTDPQFTYKYSGDFFNSTPRVQLRDAGGNLVVQDSSSALSISLHGNSYGARLGMEESLFPVAIEGVVTCNSLVIDTAGYNYTLLFSLYEFSPLFKNYTFTGVSLLSNKFTVGLGHPRALRVAIEGNGAWAGNQAMMVQPVVHVTDFGGNVLTNDFDSVVTGHIVSSLGLDHIIIIDTSNATDGFIKEVSVNLEDGTYGAGQVIDVYVYFNCEVWVNVTDAKYLPWLELGIIQVNNQLARAHMYGEFERTDRLTFRYITLQDDEVDGTSLDYTDQDAIHLNGSWIQTGNKIRPDLTLPAGGLIANHTILIVTYPPGVGVTTDTVDGTYGEGQLIDFLVSFSDPVAIEGFPYFNVTAQRLVEYENVSFMQHGIANFSYLSDDNLTAHFHYIVAPGENTLVLDVDSIVIEFPIVHLNITEVFYFNGTHNVSQPIGDGVLNITSGEIEYVNFTEVPTDFSFYNYSYTAISYTDGFIKRYSDYPTTEIDYHLPADFSLTHSIIIDTTQPTLNVNYGVVTDKADGVYYPGERIRLTVQFNKPVVVDGVGYYLRLVCGPHSATKSQDYQGFAFFEGLLNDNMTLQFLYIVEPNVDCTSLDIVDGSALALSGDSSYIRQKTTFPSCNANLSTAAIITAGKTLSATSTITLKGASPTVSSIGISSTDPANAVTLYPDNKVFIEVIFTAPVYSNCSPVLVLTNNYFREATYVSGNQTTTYLFEYIVRVGDKSDQTFSYRNTPYALCPVSGCPHSTDCKILANSSMPSLPATLKLPKSTTEWNGAVSISTKTIVPNPQGRSTNVTSIKCVQAPGEYGVGSVLQFQLIFSDIVIVFRENDPNFPRLHLNNDKYATFTSGSFTTTLLFTYVTDATDALLGMTLKPKAIAGNDTAIYCFGHLHCVITNQAGEVANLTTIHAISSVESGINLNYDAPEIRQIWSDKVTSFYDGVYSEGEVILINVLVSKPVIVAGFAPRLLMDVGVPERYALYNATLSNSTLLVFQYTVGPLDETADLTYVSGSLDLYGGESFIYRLTSMPTTELDYTLPTPKPLAVDGNVITINATLIPRVTQVVSISKGGRYAAGDIVNFRVDFDRYVIAKGNSFITLDAGGKIALAKYVGYSNDDLTEWVDKTVNGASNATKHLFYEYFVGLDDVSFDIQYADSFSLFAGLTDNNDPGIISCAASFTERPANLDLPSPGSSGSLSADGVRISVDGRVPFITKFSYATEMGTYGYGDTIEILVAFSAAVVVSGQPSILLETGEYDNQAFYVSGSGSKELLFAYSPLPGDYNTLLDYHADRLKYNSAVGSFRLNGGQILADSKYPFVEADIWLNPPGGEVRGDRLLWDDNGRCEYEGGVCEFRDLLISKRGPGYQLRYYSDIKEVNRTLTTVQNVDVSFASEFQLRPKESLGGKLIGKSVDLQGDFAILGSPWSNRSVTTLQTVTSEAAEASKTQREVQIYQTTIAPQPSIQTFHTTAEVSASVGGYFTISYGSHGPTGPIPYDAEASVMEAIITYNMHLGNLTVTRKAYTFCACDNAYTWVITFNDQTQGVFELITIDTTLLTGDGVQMIGPSMIQNSAVVAGSFKLKGLNKVTSAIPYNASVSQVTSAIHQLGLEVYDIQISPTASDHTQSWSVTFDAYKEFYDVPLLTADASGLTGGVTGVWSEVLRPGVNGPLGIGGYFQLEWRGNTTRDLLANATADEVKYALEELPVINYVNVNRSFVNDKNGYTWTVEFVDVNINTPRGYVRQDISNVEPIIPHSYLIATDVTLTVGARWEIGDRNELSGIPREGSYGEGAGAVYIYQRQNESWNQVATIVGNDTSTFNQFGGSVSLDEDVLIVGAVAANMNGVPEIQKLYCNADDGFFQISFRGWTTDYIGFNVTREEFVNSIVANEDSFSNLYTVFSVTVDSWGGGGLCQNNTAVITFFSPVDGDTLGINEGPNLELLTFVNTNLTLFDSPDMANYTVTGVQNGTWVVHGANADKQQIGAAYVFRSYYDCNLTTTHCIKTNWTQEAQLFATSSPVNSRFGHSVSVSGNIAVVGAPGSKNEQGYVYIFEYQENTGIWEHLQLIKDPSIADGDNFGHSVAIYGNTLIVGAPYYNNNTGAAYVFKRNSGQSVFVSSQTFVNTISSFSFKRGDLLGWSVAINGNLIAISGPGRDDKSIYLGSTAPIVARENAGFVLILERSSSKSNFAFLQQLTPTNVRSLDRFGYSVKIDGWNLVVSAMDEFLGNLQSDKTVVEVRTEADYNTTPLSGVFYLHWLSTSVTNNASTYTTRPIPHDATAARLKQILQADLPVGGILVSRSRVDVYDGGYSWLITFTSIDDDIALFTADTSKLRGTNASVYINYTNVNPAQQRSVTHLFQRDKIGTKFVEQLFLSPYVHQANDRCGESVAVSGNYALVGCSNRDQYVPGQNSGAGFIYDLGILGLQYTTAPTTVTEGDIAMFNITHNDVQIDEIKNDVLFYFQSYDRNSFSYFQTFMKHLYGVKKSELLYPQTFIDYIGLGGNALARSQSYGSIQQLSQWVDGMYDYLGISDYVPALRPHILLWEEEDLTEFIITTNDTIVENPEEKVSYAIFTPGVWPSPLGRLFNSFMITDVEDGIIQDEPQFVKLTDVNKEETGTNFGSVVSVCEELGVMMSGAPDATVNGRENAGKVYYYRKIDSSWSQHSYFSSPVPLLEGTWFGKAVVVTKIYSLNISLLAIGEPGANRAHVYSSTGVSVGSSYTLDATLSVPEAVYPQHYFGEAIGLSGHLMVIGAPGIDTVYIYRYLYDSLTADWYWTTAELLRCADYDYDMLDSLQFVHRQHFGKSIAISDRSIVIGAPFADYDKLGSDLPETNWHTEGTDIFGFSRGKAYVFYSTPAIHILRLTAVQQLKNGQFQLRYVHQGSNETTTHLNFNSPSYDVETALNALDNIESVTVNFHEGHLIDGYEYVWSITFNNDWQEPALLDPIWHQYDCRNCTPFSSLSETPSEQMTVSILEGISEVKIQQELQASDKQNGNRFGWSVAVDGSQIAVGSPWSESFTTSSWDFEAGTLLGWTKSGDAFDFQPTYGDNSYLHVTTASKSNFPRKLKSQSSGVEGLYYISTVEKRPGNNSNYKFPDSRFPPGSNQGDEPTGTLSSDVFIIPAAGTTINFKIGGGCDLYKVFVELVVDGLSVAKRTGKCSEKMSSTSFDVTGLSGRAAFIRIVDRATANWGHISVDSFTFDWDVAGATIKNQNQIISSGGVTETVRSGSMYVYKRVNAVDRSLICNSREFHCVWIQEAIMVASDKRQDTFFGTSVGINDKAGIAVAAAPNARFTGFYKEEPSVYPYQNASTDASIAAGLSYPVASQSQSLFESQGVYIPERSGGYGVWFLRQQQQISPDPIAYEMSGAVYVYTRSHEQITYNGTIIKNQFWHTLEHAKLQPPDAFARDFFGTSISLSGNTLGIGSPGQNGFDIDSGAVYLYRLEFACLSFESIEFHASEKDKFATVTVVRDPLIYSGRIMIEYATSDLTAKGVDSLKYKECLKMPTLLRSAAGCGDYEQTTGLIIMEAKDVKGGFTVNIVDDLCGERFLEFIQISLSVPGSASLQGEVLSTKIRIDDDDFAHDYC